MKSTRVELVQELENLPDRSKGTAVLMMIEEAKAGKYHDKESNLPNPKRALHDKLKMEGLDDLADRVIAGEFNEQ